MIVKTLEVDPETRVYELSVKECEAIADFLRSGPSFLGRVQLVAAPKKLMIGQSDGIQLSITTEGKA